MDPRIAIMSPFGPRTRIPATRATRVPSLRMVIRMRRSPMETRDTKSSGTIPEEATSPITRSPDESGYPFTLKESKPADMPSAMSHKLLDRLSGLAMISAVPNIGLAIELQPAERAQLVQWES